MNLLLIGLFSLFLIAIKHIDSETLFCKPEAAICHESKCANCSTFVACCNDYCSKRSLHGQTATVSDVKFICEDEGSIVDCKCESVCFDEAVAARRSNCKRMESFSQCCSARCPKQLQLNTRVIFSQCGSNTTLPLCWCPRYQPADRCADAYAVLRKTFGSNCTEYQECCNSYCKSVGYPENPVISGCNYFPNEPYCACTFEAGNFFNIDNLYNRPSTSSTF